MANWTNGLDPNTTVFKVYLDYQHSGSPTWTWTREDSLIVRIADFNNQPMTFKNFWFDHTISASDNFYGLNYQVYWPDSADLWVDWIEYMDLDRGYYLFWDDDLRNSVCQLIDNECTDLENFYGDTLVSWIQSNEPRRPSYAAHGVVKDYLIEQARMRRLTQNNALDMTANIH